MRRAQHSKQQPWHGSRQQQQQEASRKQQLRGPAAAAAAAAGSSMQAVKGSKMGGVRGLLPSSCSLLLLGQQQCQQAAQHAGRGKEERGKASSEGGFDSQKS
jgi:hypothetical protein